MSLAVVYSRAQSGVRAPLVTVEVHLANGLPSVSIVGMPETAVRECKDRVRSGFGFPAKRITINLAPANQIVRYCRLDNHQQQLLDIAAQRFLLSPRAIHRILKVARSIADLAGSETIKLLHRQEAIGYCCLDKTGTPIKMTGPASILQYRVDIP